MIDLVFIHARLAWVSNVEDGIYAKNRNVTTKNAWIWFRIQDLNNVIESQSKMTYGSLILVLICWQTEITWTPSSTRQHTNRRASHEIDTTFSEESLTFPRTFTYSEASLSRRGGRYIFNIDSSFESESARAMRSSTLPTRLSSRASEVSVDEDVDILIYVLVAFTHCYGVSKLEKKVSSCVDRRFQLRYEAVAFRQNEYV